MQARARLLIFLLAAVLTVAIASGCSSTPAAPASTPSSAVAVATHATAPSAKPAKTVKPSHRANKKPKPKATHATKAASSAPVTISFVNVGQGDGIVIKDGSWAGTVDGGKEGNDGAIAAELSNLGVSRLNMMLATHPDADHIGDLAAVAQEFHPDLEALGQGLEICSTRRRTSSRKFESCLVRPSELVARRRRGSIKFAHGLRAGDSGP